METSLAPMATDTHRTRACLWEVSCLCHADSKSCRHCQILNSWQCRNCATATQEILSMATTARSRVTDTVLCLWFSLSRSGLWGKICKKQIPSVVSISSASSALHRPYTTQNLQNLLNADHLLSNPIWMRDEMKHKVHFHVHRSPWGLLQLWSKPPSTNLCALLMSL